MLEGQTLPSWPDEVPAHPTPAAVPSSRRQSDDEEPQGYDGLFGSTQSALAFAAEDELAPPPRAESVPSPADPPPLKAQPIAILRLSTGLVVDLDAGVVLGRAPKVESDPAPLQSPHQTRLVSRNNDISRNHAEVFVRGGRVMVQDLGSTNGTTMALPGQERFRLQPNDPQVIEPGTVVVMADEISFTFELEA